MHCIRNNKLYFPLTWPNDVQNLLTRLSMVVFNLSGYFGLANSLHALIKGEDPTPLGVLNGDSIGRMFCINCL